MHASSMENMQKCYERYVCLHEWGDRETIKVVDIGGANVNGSYADIFSEPPFEYLAADIDSGPTVDIVIEDPYKLPFEDNSVDLIISGQAFEHVEFFWVLFEEMMRVVKKDGLVLLIAPSAGPIHRFPVDCYRFFPDSFHALAKYADCHLIDCWHDDRGPWKDLVGVFSKKYLPRFKYEEHSNASRDWKLNRYQCFTAPAQRVPRNADPETEKTKGVVNYTEILNRLHGLLRPQLYLEIGLRKGRSFSLARERAIGIDPLPEIDFELSDLQTVFPLTSDDFFEFKAAEMLGSIKPDLVFIDGMHLFEFALRDFINVEFFASPNTVVVIDDVLPNHVLQAARERQTQVWAGDIWKLVECLSSYRKDLKLSILNTSPTGLLVITGLNPMNRILRERYNPIVRQYREMELDGEIASRVLARTASIDPSGLDLLDFIK